MASFHDIDTASNDGAGTSLAAPGIDVTAGDLVCVFGKWEGAADSGATVSYAGVTVNNQADGPTINRTAGAASGDLSQRCWYGKAASTGTLTATLNTASRPFRKIVAASATPAASTELVFDASNTAQGQSTTPSAGNVTNAGAGFAFASFGEYSTVVLTAGTDWTVGIGNPVGSSLVTEYRALTTGGTITCNGTTGSSDPDWTAIGIAFKEQSVSAPVTAFPIVGRMGF